MGRKYRELKEALRTNPTRSLLVIDDWGLRLKLFSEAESIIKKIDKVERDRDNFSNIDQRLFNDWHDLTFRQEKKEMEDRRQEYISLAKFHNDIIAVAEMQNIPPHRAYHFLKEEEQRYQAGTETQRAKIDSLRQERSEFAQKAMDEEFGSPFDFEDDDEGESQDDFEALNKDALNKIDTKLYHHLKSTDPDHLRTEFSGPEAHFLAMNAMRIASLSEDPSLLIKIWDILSLKTQRHLSKDFKKNTGTPMEKFIEELRELFNGQPFEESSTNEDSDDNDFIRTSPGRSFSLSDNEERDLKFVFRKLVRLIHPDSQDPKLNENLKAWYNKVWHRVQEAYKNKDLHQLRRLEIMATIRLKELNNLTFGEIKASTKWLEEELAELRASLKSYEKHPAWKFSTKRTYDALIKRIQKEFQMNLMPILKDIEQIKDIHNFYEKASNPNLRASAKKRKSQKRPFRKPKKKSSSQMSLFD
ncbi:MAG TPA: hypothetical protein VIG33_16760 [Pseudobdellovibrionaceae bacterium]|jgi:hypothetical protein